MTEMYMKKTKVMTPDQATLELTKLMKSAEKPTLKFFKNLANDPKVFEVGKKEVQQLADKVFGGDYDKAKEVVESMTALGEKYTKGKMNYPEYCEAAYNVLRESLYIQPEYEAGVMWNFVKNLWSIKGFDEGDFIHQISEAARMGIEAVLKAVMSIATIIGMGIEQIYAGVKAVIWMVQNLQGERNLKFAALTALFNEDGTPGFSFAVFTKKEDLTK